MALLLRWITVTAEATRRLFKKKRAKGSTSKMRR